MSRRFFQDWEAAPSSPWAFGGVNIARSNTAPMDGTWDARLSTAAGGGTWTFSTPAAGGPILEGFGSARGAIIQARLKFKYENATPITGAQLSIINTSTSLGVHINDGSKKLCLQGADLSQTLGTHADLVQGQAYVLDWELRYERDTGTYQRAWLDSNPSAAATVEHRDPAGSALAGGQHNFVSGGLATAKGVSIFRWGDVTIWLASDPT